MGQSRMLRVALLLAAALAAPLPALAQADSEIVARLQALLQEATAARARLERENARLKRDVSALEKEVSALEASESKLRSALNRTSNQVDSLEQASVRAEERYDTLRESWDRLLGGCTETVYIMRDIERERASFVDRLAARNADLAQCIAVNQQLQALNDEILTRLDAGERGIAETLARKEPFTRLGKVRYQNEIDQYRYQAGDLLVTQPEALPLIPPPGSTQSIDGRWQCELDPAASTGP